MLTLLGFKANTRLNRFVLRSLAFIAASIASIGMFRPYIVTEAGSTVTLEGVQPVAFFFLFIVILNTIFILADAFGVRV